MRRSLRGCLAPECEALDPLATPIHSLLRKSSNAMGGLESKAARQSNQTTDEWQRLAVAEVVGCERCTWLIMRQRITPIAVARPA